MRGNFGPCRAFVAKWEGGNDDDPRDPGGRTSRGIEQREYDAWCALHGSPSSDVFACTDATIAVIYQAQYWNPYCDLLPKGVDLVFFDTNVNQGQHFAVASLQQALGIEADGHWGVVTAAAVKGIDTDEVTAKAVIESITAQREHRYRGTRNFKAFGKGWLNRALDCENTAKDMLT